MRDLLDGKVLAHYSASDELFPESQEQKADAGRKPRGLWVSVEGGRTYGWKEWGTENCYGDFSHRFTVLLAPDHNVLVTDDLYGFHDEYGRAQYPGEVYRYEMIDWAAVARRYQGIVIPHYHWEHRFNTAMSDWYYSWDCASGCIWDESAIASVTYDSDHTAPVNAPDMTEQEIPF
jgi:hypothetical protein